MLARNNPFNTSSLNKISYRWIDQSQDDLLNRLEKLNYRGCILGSHGSGKTTLLENLDRLLQERGHVTQYMFINRQLPIQWRSLFLSLRKTKHRHAIILLDGADLLPAHLWYGTRWFSSKGSGLIVTSHHRVLLPVLYHCRSSQWMLREILNDLIGDESKNLPLDELFAAHRGNIREVLRNLYDLYSTM